MQSTKLESAGRPVFAADLSRCNLSEWLLRGVFAVLAGVFVAGDARALTVQENQDLTGYTELEAALGSSIPIGSGVPIVQVEASSAASTTDPVYFPDPNYVDFLAGGDPNLEAVIITDASGGSANGFSAHASVNVGQFFYGNTRSFSPGANSVSVYEANHWMTSVLNLGGGTPDPHDFRVANFSWVGTFGSESTNAEALGRFDYLINQNNITAVVGINHTINTIPPLLAHSLNALAVGVTIGSNPTGTTQSLGVYNYPGRQKPDIVGPDATASAMTALVSSTATMLHESGLGTDATKSATMKAILMAGATKEEFPSWNHTATQPLDDEFGAGQLNVYNSYLIQSGGNDVGSLGQPTGPVGIDGWDYRAASEGLPLYYNFEVSAGSTATELSVILTWNAEVTDSNPGAGFTPDVSLDNLDLRFYDSSSTFLGTEVESSVSTIDNIEHIFLSGLSPGTYTLEVSNLTLGSSRDFGLAWRMETQLDAPTADFDGDGDVDGMDFLTMQSHFGTLTGASHSQGDADGDGDVDAADRLLFSSSFGQTPGILGALNRLPEPSSLWLGAAGLALLYFFRYFQRLPRQLPR